MFFDVVAEVVVADALLCIAVVYCYVNVVANHDFVNLVLVLVIDAVRKKCRCPSFKMFGNLLSM